MNIMNRWIPIAACIACVGMTPVAISDPTPLFEMPAPAEFFANNPDQRVPVSEFRTPDLDGDGIDDLVIVRRLAPGETGPLTSVFVVSHWFGETLLSVGSTVANDDFGASVRLFPDVNGDGRAEFLVSAPQSGNAVGRVDMFCGSTGTLLLQLQGVDAGATFGSAIAIGDFDGDGFQDIAVGEPGRENDTGRVVVFLHPTIAQAATTGATVLATDADATLTAGQPGEAFGYALASGADFTGDGADELVVGAPAHALPDNGVVAGRVVVYNGSTFAPLKVIRSTVPRAALGASVLLREGADATEPDLFVGAPGALVAAIDGGVTRGSVLRFTRAQLTAGVTAFFDHEAETTLTPTSPSFLHFGHDIQLGNDVNEDGIPDLVIAASVLRTAFPEEIPPGLADDPGPFIGYDTHFQTHDGAALNSLYTFPENTGSGREILIPFVFPQGGDAAPPPRSFTEGSWGYRRQRQGRSRRLGAGSCCVWSDGP